MLYAQKLLYLIEKADLIELSAANLMWIPLIIRRKKV
jgi:hypothetical protein